MEHTKKPRLHLLDAIRGFLLLNMIAYHGIWNLVYLFGVRVLWYTGRTGYLWQQFICWSFILLSGYCWAMSRSHLKRGLLVFGGGALVSLVTCILIPENRILFGILTCLGSCMLLMQPLEKVLRKIPTGMGVALSFLLFLLLRNCPEGNLGFEGWIIRDLPHWLYRNNLTAYIGFPYPEFYSTDYFPLLPWLFLFVTGYFLHRVTSRKGLDVQLFARGQVPLLNWLGRHSLLVYLLHQPVLYGLSFLFFEFWK